jgi:hypothetical protein
MMNTSLKPARFESDAMYFPSGDDEVDPVGAVEHEPPGRPSSRSTRRGPGGGHEDDRRGQYERSEYERGCS